MLEESRLQEFGPGANRPNDANSSHTLGRSRCWFWCRWMLLITVTCLVGCSGCKKEEEKLSREELEKRARERRESIEMSELVSLPTDSDTKILTAKPGHWHETQKRYKSNREDLQVVAVGSVSRGSELAKIPGTNFVNEFTRRTSLPKGQTKTVDLQFFVPFSGKKADPNMTVSSRLTMRTELLSWPLMTPILQSPSLMPANELKENEFQLVAVGPKALSYGFLTVSDAVLWRGSDLDEGGRTRSYYVSLVKPDDNRYPMPTSMLTMTAIAVIVWDDVSPDNLSERQKTALIDWLHWGGQLIVSGPSSWARLQNSFLSPYMPCESIDAAEFTTEDFAELSNTWIRPDLNRRNQPGPIEIVTKPIGGLSMELAGEAAFVPGTGDLVAERQVGRGRIVMTGFSLNEPQVYRWRYFSSFFSTGLLRRHPRMVKRPSPGEELSHVWTKPYESATRDARLHTNVRILTRDLPLSSSAGQQLSEQDIDGMGGDAFQRVAANQLNVPEPGATEGMQWGGRGAAWNDYSGLSYEALEALKSAAGIELPSKRTILYLLAGYLLCLVPLNWLLFRLVGRLEFAWIAAPLMALAGVVVVTKVARLDIGFARRTTEISVLELYGNYPRGHLTQYLALYTSLSTNYAVDFPDTDSVALPLGDISRTVKRATADTRSLRTNYGRSEGVTLEPLTVYSNSTEMVHAEQIVDLQGPLRLGSREAGGAGLPALRNDVGIDLISCMVVRRTEDGTIETAWVGDLASGQSATIKYDRVTAGGLWDNWANNSVTQPERPETDENATSDEDSLWIGGVLKELVRKTPLMPGQTRLFGYTNRRTGALSVKPAEDQFDGRCVVIAHLTPQLLSDIEPDVNILSPKSSLQIDASNKEDLDAELAPLRQQPDGEPLGESLDESIEGTPD